VTTTPGIGAGRDASGAAPGALRSQFPVLDRVVYLNAGTDGPLPARAATAGSDWLAREAERGRGALAHFADLIPMMERLRGRFSALLGADAGQVALTRSTTDGINAILSALPFAPGDEVVTSDQEHPGLLAPLAALTRRAGVRVRVAPFDSVADALGPRTRLVAVSHVAWTTGAIAPVENLRAAPVPVLLDGAQALGAIPVDVERLGCDFYAAPGQKWLCGPDGVGCAFVRESAAHELGMPWPNYLTLADPEHPLASAPLPGARRLDAGIFAGALVAAALAALDVLEEEGWDVVFAAAAARGRELRAALAERGATVEPAETTLVAWRATDDDAAMSRLADLGVVVRSIPGHGLLRASVGAWNSSGDIDRLVSICAENNFL
jgi:L-cysteine/cystine lyase